MKYTFCTIAIGDSYLDDALKLSETLHNATNDSHFVIVTDVEKQNTEKTTFIQIPKEKKLFIQNWFNFNLKYYPIKKSKELGYEFIIFIDADWSVNNELTQHKLDDLFKYMDSNNLDILFERPHLIGGGKVSKDCFWTGKRELYKLLYTNEYDDGHVANEQFLVFKNNNKLNLFIDRWESLEEQCSVSDVWAFAEGVEIGMSMSYSKMNYNFYEWQKILPNCFNFTTKDNRYFNKF
jgi:hypothetical protein